MPKILLTSVIRPFGGDGEGDSVGAELFHAQVTRAQGMFSLRQVIRCWAIDYLAENIEAPCTVLHYPSEREFVRELKKGGYDYVGINFVVATFHKLRRMSALVRKYAPAAKIILGGYGTVLPEEMLAPFGDHICREEGIAYLRRLLGENGNQAIRHPYAPIPSVRLYSYQQPSVVAHLTAGLGCPNGCDFCCTSHFFNRQYITFLKSGRDIYEEICSMQEKALAHGDDLSGFILIDEDFFLQKKRAREFLECVRQGGKPLSLMGFGSVKGLSQFSADEIAEMGFDTIWTAFEGKEAGYHKLRGKSLHELYPELKSRGINILSSMIVGFPYQNRQRILQEFSELVELGPSLTQILIYFAFPGTPFHRQVTAEGRYLPEYRDNPDLRKWDGFAMHFHHPHFKAEELEELQKHLFQQDFEQLGPSIVRLVRVWLEGHKNLTHSTNPLLRARAERLSGMARNALPGLIPAMIFGPNRERRVEAQKLFTEAYSMVGGFTLFERLSIAFAPLLALWTSLAQRLRIFQQPGLLRLEHRMQKAQATVPSIKRLQGGFHAGPFRSLFEDLWHNTISVLQRLIPRIFRFEKPYQATLVTRPFPVSHDDQ